MQSRNRYLAAARICQRCFDAAELTAEFTTADPAMKKIVESSQSGNFTITVEVDGHEFTGIFTLDEERRRREK